VTATTGGTTACRPGSVRCDYWLPEGIRRRILKLREFRVENYKRIEDTGWVKVGALTLLVGKNESGKSAILRGLSKLNPSDKEEYDGLREFPRRRFSDEYDEFEDVATARYELSAEDREALTEISPLLESVTSVDVTRRYDNKWTVGFAPSPGRDGLLAKDVRAQMRSALDAFAVGFAPDGNGEDFKPLKEMVTGQVVEELDSLPTAGEMSLAHLEALSATVTSHIGEQWHQTALAPLTDVLRPMVSEARDRAGLPKGRNWIVSNMPQFIYFDRYDVLDSAVHIPTFLQQLASNPHQPRLRTTQCLFRHVELDPVQLNELNQGIVDRDEMRRRVDERAIRTASAGQAMTEKFGAWWLQRRHKFRYDLDGDFFRVWVSDDLDPSEIELDQRSQGMQYFFSFFLVFLVEAADAHKNSILLLDEPGNSLHGTAQAKIIEFLRNISSGNQVIYSTHSPFMVDGDHLEEVRPVWEDPKTGSTNVSDNVWPKDKDALFPLQAALGYQLAQSLFISRHQVLIEGITDFWLLKALDLALAATERHGLHPDVILTPGGGAGRLVPLASMLVGHEVRVAALLDGDESGRKEGQKLERILGYDNRTIFVGDHTPDQNLTGEIEDLFTDDYYMAAVKRANGSGDYRFNATEKAIPNIVDRISALFERKGLGKFEKWKVARVLADTIMAEPNSVPAETLDSVETLVGELNQITQE
jgi:energy-coupling factor transporter ATP-binding protein EcfA2